MSVLYVVTAGLLLAVAPTDNGPADWRPTPDPETARPASGSILERNAEDLQPAPAVRSPAELQEEIRQLKRRVYLLERQLAASQGPQLYGAIYPIKGKLVLDNQTESAHWVSVNGILYSVAPGRTEMGIPVNRATVYLPYHEAPKQWNLDRWRWNGQSYELLVTIAYP